ncbi:unnamed protein product [Rotaria sordida]|uniref:PiggyBac transposable element-derived protein domain-containing protein n=1 Tax=Rotaria sordida TaxID=392033 RepID=A0A815PXV2_9BILA|nr:unnamed protein product [Rotaria sordida]CAF3733542.1 unnamed protein product [Rotaria sordida]
MTTKTNLKRIREILITDNTNEFTDNISEDDESNSDPDYSFSDTESDDTSTDERISNEEDSSDAHISNDDTQINAQPESIEKGGVSWSTQRPTVQGRVHAINIMKTKPGPVTVIQTMMDAFKLFLTDEILNEVVLQTNKYAKRYMDQRNQRQLNDAANQTKLKKWKELDRTELEAFLGLLIQAGVGHASHTSVTELWDISKSPPIYHATMSLERFKDLLRFLRFDDRQLRDKFDRLAPIRTIFECFVKQLPQHFIPSENLTIDEQLVPFRGRCSFVQYMPKKPSKYGLKFWVLCDVDSRYVLALELYTGKIGNVIQRNLATNVVLRLVDQLPNKVKQGRNVTYDRFFSDFHLAQALLERKMTSLGVVNHKRCFIPNELKVIRNDLYSSWFYFAGQTMILSYQAKQKKPPVILLSTLHDFPEILDDEKKLPAMIHDYNQTKIGVDVVDQCINNYTARRISRRWSLMVFFNMIDIAAINAMTIWLCQNPEWNNRKKHIRRLFLEQLSKSLTNPHNQRRSEQSHLTSKVKLALQSLGYELKPEISLAQVNTNDVIKIKKRCYLCPVNPGRKVRQSCDICQNNVCNSHSSSSTTVICQECEKMM